MHFIHNRGIEHLISQQQKYNIDLLGYLYLLLNDISAPVNGVEPVEPNNLLVHRTCVQSNSENSHLSRLYKPS